MARNILVTGGTGFIGRELCAHLLARGDRVAVFSRQDSDTVRALCGKVEPSRSWRHCGGTQALTR